MKKNCIVFGAGPIYRILKICLSDDYRIIALADNDLHKQGTIIEGISVIPPENIKNLHYDKIFIAVKKSSFDEVLSQLREIGVLSKDIVSLEQYVYTEYNLIKHLERYRRMFSTYVKPENDPFISSICRPTEYFYLKKQNIFDNGKFKPNRKSWEWMYIYQALKERGMLMPGKKGLGFACGKEPLPSMFANTGCDITATDAHPDIVTDKWAETNQHSNQLEDLFYPLFISDFEFKEHVSFKYIDMKNIPDDENGYDFIWSSCSLEHLGSMDDAKQFIYNSLKCLKKGGIAVHTTEYNLSSSIETLIDESSCILRSIDLIEISEHIEKIGSSMEPLDFRLDGSQWDNHIAYPPYLEPHFKLFLQGFISTSCGLIIKK